MRRAGNLFEAIAERENLRLAFYKSLRGKRANAEARHFAASLESNLRRLADELLSQTLTLGVSRQFTIYDPKQRTIIAPCFRERVLHHAVMNVCEPVLDRWLIDATYACRRGKGQSAALQDARHFARRYPFFLKFDIRKYFDSIPHDGLLDKLARRIKDRRVLCLLEQIVRTGRPCVGLPIGSLTSQHLANFYLGFFDRLAKEQFRVPAYVRYMDDFVLWGRSSAELKRYRATGGEFLHDELQLDLRQAFINRTAHGMDWLGCRVFPSHMALNRRSRRRFTAKLRFYESAYLAGRLQAGVLQQRVQALVAFTRMAGLSTCRWRRAVLEGMPVSGQGLEPRESWRELEQQRQELPVGESEQQLAGQPEQQPGLPRGRSSARVADANSY